MIALVLGSADCVDQDVDAALELFDPDCVIAVNDMIARWHGPIDHAASLHPEKMRGWLAARAQSQPDRPTVWCHFGSRPPFDCQIDRMVPDWKGSSGLLGVTVALELGMAAVVCGIPMVSRLHVTGRSSEGWKAQPWPQVQVDSYRIGWTEQLPRLVQAVRSMSGWTAEQLGKPDPSWIAVNQNRPNTASTEA